MSSRFLYHTLRPENRICSYYRCQKRIFRNIATDKAGRIYHWGCYQTALDEQYRCLECHLQFDATEAGVEEKQKFIGDAQKTLFTLTCPECGSLNIHNAAKHHDIVTGRLVSCL